MALNRSILNKMKSFTSGSLLFFFILTIAPLTAHGVPLEDEILEVESHIDWMSGILHLDVHYTPPPGMILHSSIRQRALEKTKSELTSLFLKAIGDMNIDSRTKVHQMVLSSPSLVDRIVLPASSGSVHVEGFNRDFSSFTRKYTFPLYPDIAELFISHNRAVPQIPTMQYVAGGKYSGIVIYVEGPLPLHGANRQEELSPALFPRIYSRSMECIISSLMVSPERIREGGMVRYYSEENIERIHSRVGEVPLYVHAVGVFGRTPTDLIVSDRAARQIRADEHTLSLIRDGKIAIIYSED